MKLRSEVIGLFVAVGAATVAGASACSSSSDTPGATITCGAGTHQQDNTCVADPVDSSVPVTDSSTVTCGPGTVLEGGVCVVPGPGAGPTFDGVTDVTSTSPTTATLNWAAATDATTSADKLFYRIYVTQKTGTETFGSPQFTTLPGKLSFTVTGLDAGGTYFFVVRAVNAAGVEDTNKNEKSIATSPDTVPPQFAGALFVDFIPDAAGSSAGKARITWAPATDDKSGASEIAYEVYESVTPGGEDFAGVPKVTVTGTNTAEVTPVDYTISHFYVVLARDKAGNKNPNKVERKAQKVPNLTDHIMPILVGIPGVANSAKCAREGGCHLGPSAPGGLAMDTVDNAYNNLVKVPASARYNPPWPKDMMLDGGTDTLLPDDSGVDKPGGSTSFTATLSDIQPKFGAPYDETTYYRVLPGLPIVSFMYQKITNTQHRKVINDTSNTEMPNPASSGAALTTEERDRIKAWILGGALKGPA